MKLVEFQYTKADGTTSRRAVIELVQPSVHFEGIDVSHFEGNEFADFVSEYRELKNQQAAATQELLLKHDLKHNYRRFIPAQMSAVVSEYI